MDGPPPPFGDRLHSQESSRKRRLEGQEPPEAFPTTLLPYEAQRGLHPEAFAPGRASLQEIQSLRRVDSVSQQEGAERLWNYGR